MASNIPTLWDSFEIITVETLEHGPVGWVRVGGGHYKLPRMDLKRPSQLKRRAFINALWVLNLVEFLIQNET